MTVFMPAAGAGIARLAPMLGGSPPVFRDFGSSTRPVMVRAQSAGGFGRRKTASKLRDTLISGHDPYDCRAV